MRTPGWLLVAALLAVGETINPGTTKNIPSYSSPTSTTTTTTTLQNVTSSSSSNDDDDDIVVVGPSAGSQDPPAPKDTFISTSSTTATATLKIPPTVKKRKQVISGTASASLRRIKKEYKDVVQMGICYDWVKGRLITSSTTHRDNKDNADVQFIVVGPLATNLRHWHFSFRGVKNSLYESGIYHGRILLPKDYPKSPPRVQLMTPSGRFKPFADICLSASAFHPESWTPQWTVLSLVHGLRLHMLTNPQEIGGVMSSADDILEYARRSRAWKFAWMVGTT
jgi:ubiquitin-protein ligase